MRKPALDTVVVAVTSFPRIFPNSARRTKKIVAYILLSGSIALARTSAPTPSSQLPQQETSNAPSLNQSEVSQLQNRAEAGDATAQSRLGKAYQDGNGVPQNDVLAAKWFRKAADQGDPAAENSLGFMYRTGEGVSLDKEEAVRWYASGAKHGSPQAMFNLGTSYYNGDGVASNEFTAYAWFLLAGDAGDPIGVDAARRSAASMSKTETSDALLQIAAMYEKGDQLPKSDEQAVLWLRKAAEIDSRGKLRLAVHLLNGPGAPQSYVQILDLCKAAAKDYAPAQSCVGYMYRKGLGVPQDPAEAAKWYQKGAAASNAAAILALAEMYSSGEGMKVDRPAAFMLLFRASMMDISGSREKARALLPEMSKSEVKEVQKKLSDQRFDPKKVFAAIQAHSPP